MKTLLETTQSVLANAGIRCNVNDEQNRIYFSIGAKNGNWSIYVNLDEDLRKFCIISVCPIRVSDGQKSAICELINRINNRIFLGKFCLDNDEGEITLQNCAAFPESYVGDETIDVMFRTNIQAFDEYLPALIAVIYRHNEPALAFLEVESANA